MDDVAPSMDCTLRLDVQSQVVVPVGSNSSPLFTLEDLTDGVCRLCLILKVESFSISGKGGDDGEFGVHI